MNNLIISSQSQYKINIKGENITFYGVALRNKPIEFGEFTLKVFQLDLLPLFTKWRKQILNLTRDYKKDFIVYSTDEHRGLLIEGLWPLDNPTILTEYFTIPLIFDRLMPGV